MSAHRFVAAHPVTGSRAEIDGQELHHLRNVLRLAAGDHLILNDPQGAEFAAVLESVGSTKAVARIVARLESRGILPITLFQSILKGPKMELVIQKSTELGVAEIVPLEGARNVARLEGARVEAKLERWRRIAAEASKQSGRAVPPSIGLPVTVDTLSSRVKDFAACVVFWEETKDELPHETLEGLRGKGPIAVVVGPEGGLLRDEVSLLQESGARRAGLGPLVLRSETAALAALAIIGYELRRARGSQDG